MEKDNNNPKVPEETKQAAAKQEKPSNLSKDNIIDIKIVFPRDLDFVPLRNLDFVPDIHQMQFDPFINFQRP